MKGQNFADQFRAARRAAVPIIAVRTLDNYATEARLLALMGAKGDVKETPLIRWDVVNGWTPLNKSAEFAVAQALSGGDVPLSATINRVESLALALKTPGVNLEEKQSGTVLLYHSFHRFVQGATPDEADTHQAVLNVRDDFKSNMRTLVLLGTDFIFPPELQQHVILLDEPLPDAAQLSTIVESITKQKKIKLAESEVEKAVDALQGLAAFPAEQSLAICSDRSAGLNFDALWERKRQIIASTKGLSVYRAEGTLDDVGGCQQIKAYLQRILTGRRAPKAIVWIDEVEKAFAGATSDTADSSGVSQGFLGELLSEMQDQSYTGLMFVGVAGGGKSWLAKAAGSITGIPTIRFSLSAMKGSLVGESEQNLRHALKVVHAVSGGKALFIATSNNVTNLPAELRSRFTLGTWFFGLPTKEESAHLWQMYTGKHGLPCVAETWLDKTKGWTGREIAQACDIADRTGMAIEETFDFIVPVAKTDAKRIAELETQAEAGFLSASQPGVYRKPFTAQAVAPGTQRADFDL